MGAPARLPARRTWRLDRAGGRSGIVESSSCAENTARPTGSVSPGEVEGDLGMLHFDGPAAGGVSPGGGPKEGRPVSSGAETSPLSSAGAGSAVDSAG